MLRLRLLGALAPTLLVMLACGAARLSEITITELPATVGSIAELQRNAPAAHCAYDLRESTPAVAIFNCDNDLTIRFANIDGRLSYACMETTEARCQAAAAPLLGITVEEAHEAETMPAPAEGTMAVVPEPAPAPEPAPPAPAAEPAPRRRTR